jgi:hypothetical protein
MLISIKTFNGHSINDGVNYKATGLTLGTIPQSNPVFISQMRADSVYSKAYTVDTRNIPVQIQIIDYANRYDLAAQLKHWMKPGTSGDLVITFTDENKDYFIPCVVQSCVLEKGGYFTVVLQSGDSMWKAVDVSTDTWSITGTGSTKTVTNAGTENTKLAISLLPTGTPTVGYLYQNVYKLVNTTASYGVIPYCITMDTSGLVPTKMQADGDDLRVLVNGVEVNRWIYGIGTATTKIWINISLKAGYVTKLRTAIASSGSISTLDALIVLGYDKVPRAGGILCVGNEYFTYTGWKSVGTYIQYTGVKRAAYNTSMASHAINDIVSLVENAITVIYGNSAVSSPDSDDPDTYNLTKPCFDLSSSDNTKWVYTASTVFNSGNRTGAFIPSVVSVARNLVTEYYKVTENAETGNVALGMQIGCTNKSETATVAWKLYHGGGIKTVSSTGKKYRNSATWLPTNTTQKAAGLQKSINGVNWYSVWDEATPTVLSTWQAWTHNSASTTTNGKYIRFILQSVIIPTPAVTKLIDLEVLTCTVEFYSYPSGSFVGEKSNYTIDLMLENETTTDIIYLKFQMLIVGSSFVPFIVDSENYAVTYNSLSAYKALKLDDDSKDVWLSLQPGSNTLKITATGLGTMDAALSWYQRRA